MTAESATTADDQTSDNRAEVVLRVEGATKRFGGVVAVQGISFEVRRGEIAGLIGPNGAGKTTLINLITGVERPTAARSRSRGRS